MLTARKTLQQIHDQKKNYIEDPPPSPPPLPPLQLREKKGMTGFRGTPCTDLLKNIHTEDPRFNYEQIRE